MSSGRLARRSAFEVVCVLVCHMHGTKASVLLDFFLVSFEQHRGCIWGGSWLVEYGYVMARK